MVDKNPPMLEFPLSEQSKNILRDRIFVRITKIKTFTNRHQVPRHMHNETFYNLMRNSPPWFCWQQHNSKKALTLTTSALPVLSVSYDTLKDTSWAFAHWLQSPCTKIRKLVRDSRQETVLMWCAGSETDERVSLGKLICSRIYPDD